MAKVFLKILVLFFGFFALISFTPFNKSLFAETETEKLERLAKEIESYERELKRLNSQSTTLSNQIAQYDAQIKLTTLKIEQTKEKIALLGGRIYQLETSLEALTKAFTSRVVKTYKMTRVNEPILMMVTSPDLGAYFSSFHYLRKIQASDRELLFRLENAQLAYEEEKKVQENLQNELNDQKLALDSQKAAKAKLLEQTRNDEKRYQQLLQAARAEFEAIQAIIAGKGEEVEVGKVGKGERIASVIQGASCNSSGEHLHFIVKNGNQTQNPFNYLKGGIDYQNCSGPSCDSPDADPFNPSGSWDWPISPRIKFTQGYGSTWATRNTWVGNIYKFHNGIDIKSESSPEVRAVEAGILFRGSYTGYNGCRLRYVRVDHENSDLETLYLHINY